MGNCFDSDEAYRNYKAMHEQPAVAGPPKNTGVCHVVGANVPSLGQDSGLYELVVDAIKGRLPISITVGAKVVEFYPEYLDGDRNQFSVELRPCRGGDKACLEVERWAGG